MTTANQRPAGARQRVATAVHAAGLALSAYLAALKLLALPCFGADCGVVIGSTYGAIFGIPVGLFGLVCWLLAVLSPRARPACLLLLGAGSLYFTGIQAFILHAVCPWCLAHAIATGAGLVLWRVRPSRHAVWIGIILAAAAAALAQYGAKRSVASQARRADALFMHPAALAWLGPVNRDSPVLIISLKCPSCLDLLGSVAAKNLSGHPAGPALFLKVEDADRDLAIAVAAAVEAQGGNRDAFLTVAGLLLAQRDLVLGDPRSATAWIKAVFPQAATHLDEAERRISRNTAALAAAHITAAPLLIDRAGGTPRIDIKPDDLFPAAR